MLQALYELAQDEGLLDDPDFEPKPVAWLIRVGDGGKLLGIESTAYTPQAEGKKKPKPLFKSFRVPRQPTGRAGTKAPSAFFVDNAKYVFGLPTADKAFSEAEGHEKASWFRDLVEKCSVATNDPAAEAVLNFLNQVAIGTQKIALPKECKSNELFAFIYSNDEFLVHDRQAIREYWNQSKRGNQSRQTIGQDEINHCLVTGKITNEVPLFPLIKRVPGGATAGVGLVSFNKNAFLSHGWEGNANAPISSEAANACRDALNRLLDPNYPDPKNPGQTLGSRHIRISDDTVVCFWAKSQQGNALANWFSDILNPDDPVRVGELYRSLWAGRTPAINDTSAFYAVTLSGAQGRAVVRDWLETTVGQVTQNLAQYFSDLAIVRNTPVPKSGDLPPALPLRVLLRSLAPLGDEKGIPDPLAAKFVHAALYGSPFPIAVMQKAIERMRAEIGRKEWSDLERRDGRAALIKAVLIRSRRFSIGVKMNPQTDSPGYNLGALLAVLEQLQRTALPNINASLIDRYFGSASATPRSVFTRLLRNAQNHARKARDIDNRSSTTAFLLMRIVDELATRFLVDVRKPGYANAQGFPAHLALDEQGLFVIGYHQMRKWLWMSKEERQAWNQQYPAAPRAMQWGTKDEPEPAIV